MDKIRIKNFGPIDSSCCENSEFITISKVTVFLGEQGSGKSTICKLISTFLWLEKALSRGDFDETEIDAKTFCENYLGWQNISSYIQNNTELEFYGSKYHFLFKEKNFTVKKIDSDKNYVRPKISYIPAERNFCSSIPRAQQISGVFHNLAVVIDDFQNASEKLEKTGLPVGGFEYCYDKNTKRKYISSKGKEIQLYESASGLQSLTPLFVISKYFSEPSLALKDNSISALSSDQRNQIIAIVARKGFLIS